MRIGAKRVWTALGLLLLLVLGVAGYAIGVSWWGSSHYRAAEQALERRDFPQASLHLKKCLNAWPNDLSLRLLAAQTARRQDDYKTALRYLQTYREKNGSPEPAALEHRLLALQQGDPAEANTFFSQCIDHPEAPETPLILEAVLKGSLKVLGATGTPGMNLEEKEENPGLARARRAVDLWLRLRPGQADQAQGLAWRGMIHGLAGDRPRAIADLRQALELDPDHFDARMSLVLFVGLGNPEEAAAHLEVLRRRYPQNKDVCYSLATVRRTLGQLEEAGQLLDEVLAADPDHVSALVERGYVAMNARQTEAAERWLRRAYDLAPDEPQVNLALSGCLHLAGREAEATHYQNRGLELDRERKRQRQEWARNRKPTARE